MTEFKIGDKVRRSQKAIDEENFCTNCVVNGVPQICEVLSVDSNSVFVKCPNGKTETFNFGDYELAIGKLGRPKKVPPVELHIVLEDSCRNVVNVATDYNAAESVAKSRSQKVSIYKLVKVADVDSVRKVTKVRVGRKK